MTCVDKNKKQKIENVAFIWWNIVLLIRKMKGEKSYVKIIFVNVKEQPSPRNFYLKSCLRCKKTFMCEDEFVNK